MNAYDIGHQTRGNLIIKVGLSILVITFHWPVAVLPVACRKLLPRFTPHGAGIYPHIMTVSVCEITVTTHWSYTFKQLFPRREILRRPLRRRVEKTNTETAGGLSITIGRGWGPALLELTPVGNGDQIALE